MRSGSQGGFTYLGLVFGLALLGLASAASLKAGALAQRRQAEDALVETGLAFRQALQSYAAASTAGQRRSPKSLEDLLLDRRSTTPRRHLRQLYADPVTGSTQWGLVYDKDFGIIGVHSRSDAPAIKIANFPKGLERLEGKTHLKEWVFAATL